MILDTHSLKTKKVLLKEENGELYLDIYISHESSSDHLIKVGSISLDSMTIEIEEDFAMSTRTCSERKQTCSFSFGTLTLEPIEELQSKELTLEELNRIIKEDV
jgi:hypothetical protein